MAKEYYNVSYRTYFNERIKPVVFQGEETYPLYVQVTYDRRTLFFKSYYFDLFSQPKYDFLKTTIAQIDELESGLIDYIVNDNYNRFQLDDLPRQYKKFSLDILDSFDRSFKLWLAGIFKKEGFHALGVLLEFGLEEVPAIRLWEEIQKISDPVLFKGIEEKAMRSGQPYIALAAYVRHKRPTGPFCMPLYEWNMQEKEGEIEAFFDKRVFPDGFWGDDVFYKIIKAVNPLFHKSF
jgi:hypothetical protein